MTTVVTEPPHTYAKGNPRRSYLQDLVRMSANLDHTGEARDRLMRHAREVETAPSYAEYRALDRVDGSGGDTQFPRFG